MPKQILFGEVEFEKFRKSMLARSFREITSGEFRSDFIRLNPEPPSFREGREVGFTFKANGYEVVVWTTYIEANKIARKSDAGRVLIKDGDDVIYHSHPMHRTKNFLHNLLLSAAIAKERVLNRPLCPKCGAYMHVKKGKGLKARYYQCTRRYAHSKPVNRSWDYGLPEIVLKEVLKIRKRRLPYVKKLAAQGKKPGAALKRRRKWVSKNPKNMV